MFLICCFFCLVCCRVEALCDLRRYYILIYAQLQCEIFEYISSFNFLPLGAIAQRV